MAGFILVENGCAMLKKDEMCYGQRHESSLPSRFSSKFPERYPDWETSEEVQKGCDNNNENDDHIPNVK